MCAVKVRNAKLRNYLKPIPNTFSNYSNDESYCCFQAFISEWETPTCMAAIYSNGGNRWNILGFNFTKRDALSSVCKIYMLQAPLRA
jgi:hypothetical protein